MHIYLLSVRFRSLPPSIGPSYVQELINHSFIDFEQRLRGPKYRVTKGTLVKRYMKDLLDQQRGLFTALDLAIVADEIPRPPAAEGEDRQGGAHGRGDAELAAAIWRNIFGAGWGKGMGGVSGVFSSDAPGPATEGTPAAPLAEEQASTAPKAKTDATGPVIAEEIVAAEGKDDCEADAEFVENLERIVRYVRREMARLDAIPDEEIRVSEKGEAVNFGDF